MENSAAEKLQSDLYGLAFILCFALVLMLCNGLFLYATTGTERITIKEIRFGQDQAVTKYMIYTRDGQVLKNANTIFFMKFKSDELFMKLKAGKTYEVKTCGLRVPFLGWYKNIITAKEIKPVAKKENRSRIAQKIIKRKGETIKKLALILPAIILAACDRPQYDVQLTCNDDILVNAKIYKSHADLDIKRFRKKLNIELQYRNSYPFNQISQIDDEIKISLSATENEKYELVDSDNKVTFVIDRNALTGGIEYFHLMSGHWGVTCTPVLYTTDTVWKKLSTEQKNCLNYIDSQLHAASVINTPTGNSMGVYDENTGREIYIDSENINEIFLGIAPENFYLDHIHTYPEVANHACDVASRMRTFISSYKDIKPTDK